MTDPKGHFYRNVLIGISALCIATPLVFILLVKAGMIADPVETGIQFLAGGLFACVGLIVVVAIAMARKDMQNME